MDRSRCRWCRSLNVIAVRVLVVVVLRRVLCEVSAGTLASRCGTMCACARAPAQRTKTLFNVGENRGLRMWGVIPIHPPVQTCYKFAFAMALHSVCVFPRSLTFRTKKREIWRKMPNLLYRVRHQRARRWIFLWARPMHQGGR